MQLEKFGANAFKESYKWICADSDDIRLLHDQSVSHTYPSLTWTGFGLQNATKRRAWFRTPKQKDHISKNFHMMSILPVQLLV